MNRVVNNLRAIWATALLLVGGSALATPITTDGQWYEFQFGGTGSFATACTGCAAGVNSVFVGAPAWTFSGPTLFTVTDAFAIGDIFEVFDNSVSLGLTSAPGAGPSACASNDPTCILAEGIFSNRSFALADGDHSITIRMAASPFGGGAAFFRATSVPEPVSLALFGLGILALAFVRRGAVAKSA